MNSMRPSLRRGDVLGRRIWVRLARASRNAILLAAAIFLLLAFVMDSRLFVCIFSQKGVVVQGLLVSVFAYAYVVRSVAGNCTRGPGDPWYTRKGAPLFLALATFGVSLLMAAATEFVFGQALGSSLPLTLEYGAIGLIAIVLIDWPHAEDQPQSGPPTSQQPSSGSPTDGLWRDEKR